MQSDLNQREIWLDYLHITAALAVIGIHASSAPFCRYELVSGFIWLGSTIFKYHLSVGSACLCYDYRIFDFGMPIKSTRYCSYKNFRYCMVYNFSSSISLSCSRNQKKNH